MKKSILGAAAAGTAAVGAAVCAVGAVTLFNRVIPRQDVLRVDLDEMADMAKWEEYKKVIAPNKEWLFAQEMEHITIKSRDGLTLHGDFLPAETKSDKLAICGHGYTGCGLKDCVSIAVFFHRMGYNCLIVMLLNSNYIDNAMCQDNEASPEDTILSVLPIHHIYCFTCDIMLSLRYGTTLCFNDSMMHIPQNLKRFAPTIMLIVPMIAETMYKQIKAAAAQKPEIPIAMIAQSVFGGRLKTIYSGGAYLRPELQKAYIDMGFSMAQGYGMTECSPRISTGAPDDKSCAGDVGVIVNGCEVKTVDGEILVKSPSVMAGYYKDEKATAEALTPDGWLRTGDLGYADENRRIFITGRKKNLIILSNGENVSPEELENKFAGYDLIGDVLVYSEDSVITAEIYPAAEALKVLSAEEIEKKILEITDGVNKTVSSAKAIRRVLLRDVEFEKTTSKKIKRNQPKLGKRIR